MGDQTDPTKQPTSESLVPQQPPTASVTPEVSSSVSSVSPNSTITTEPSPPTQPKKSNLLIKLGLIMIILGILTVTGYFFFQNQKEKNKLTSSNTSPTSPQNISLPSPTPDPTENWETYSNTNFKITFKYPSNFDLQTIPSSDLKNNITLKLMNNNNKPIISTLKASKKYLPNNVIYYLDTESSGVKEINGISWKEFILPQGYQDAGAKTLPIYALQTEKNNILYSLTFSNQEELNQQQIQILSTFKFVETTINPTNTDIIKTYTGLGMTFKYPSFLNIAKPVNTTQKIQPGGFYQQSFNSTQNINLLLNVDPRTKDSSGNYPSLDDELKSISVKEHITVNGMEAIKVVNDGSPNSYNVFFTLLTPGNESRVTVNIFAQPANQTAINKAGEVFTQISSTFKFID